jgi:hypothetical protein
MSQGLRDTGVVIEERMERGKDQGRRVMESVKKGAVAVKDKMSHIDRENVRTNLRRAQSYAKENPGKVVLASLALGWIFGALRRRGHGKVRPLI